MQDGPRGDPPAGPDEDLPGPVAVELFEQQHLDGSAGLLGEAQAGGQHPGVVEHDHVAGADQVRQVAHRQVSNPVAEVDQEPGRRAILEWLLGNRRSGKVVGEVGRSHGGRS